jgi:hypothetical protein
MKGLLHEMVSSLNSPRDNASLGDSGKVQPILDFFGCVSLGELILRRVKVRSRSVKTYFNALSFNPLHRKMQFCCGGRYKQSNS